MNLFEKSLKAVTQLGLPKIWFFTLYQIGLQTGHYQRATPSQRDDFKGQPVIAPYSVFPTPSQEQITQTLTQADEILQGNFRPFGGEPEPLNLHAGASDQHWSVLERIPPEKDIKLIWEPGRFTWAITLARAFAFSGDPVYASDFWEKASQFLDAHPPNLGRQWQSAQEVAIRLMVLTFCDRAFASALQENQRQRLWQAIAEHARRIPPTLVYARAQNNNHLMSEAAGLYTAGLYLADHPQAEKWRQLGLRWLNWGFQHQIDASGTYVQHSANYHRLMLQVALFADHYRRLTGALNWPAAAQSRLASATRWLWALTDPETGHVPNLGANDGAYLFPLTGQSFDDFRPVVAAASRAFLQEDIYQDPALNEMARWFGLEAVLAADLKQPQASDMLRLESDQARAFIHTAHYWDRPSHADQLHVDLWWHGVNIAMDPGTHQYNAPPPWDNALKTGFVHNTLTLDGQDQMSSTGRFLWLDWAQAEVLSKKVDAYGNLLQVTAEHNGYRRLGALHRRTLKCQADGWQVTDVLVPSGNSDGESHEVVLTWLLPDWEWKFTEPNTLLLTGPRFSFRINLVGVDQVALVRVGECLYGEVQSKPAWGWFSPTYHEKQPALMLIGQTSGKLPVELQSTWTIIP